MVFWAFRVMVGLGLLMIALGLWGAWLIWRTKGPEHKRPFLWACVIMGPSGFVAVIAGWIVAEVGRQPYVVYGLLRTADAVSPLGSGSVSASLLGFLIVYGIVFSVGALYILRLIAIGPRPPETPDTEPPLKPRPPGYALGAAPDPEERA